MKKKRGNVLLVEDDKNLGSVLKDFLEMEHYKVVLALNGEEGFAEFKKGAFDICVLDVMLPIKDGFTLAGEIRQEDDNVPIVFLTARSLTEDKIKGLKIGADDYITKPFSTEELLLRIEAVLKRSKPKVVPADKKSVSIGKLVFDYANQILVSPQGERKLTKKEAEMLHMLYMYKNQLLPRRVALKAIWGDDDYFMGRSMDVYITKLRKMLKDDKNLAITNVHNAGFKLEIKESSHAR
jgi:two-component system, OmpR family, response regulator